MGMPSSHHDKASIVQEIEEIRDRIKQNEETLLFEYNYLNQLISELQRLDK